MSRPASGIGHIADSAVIRFSDRASALAWFSSDAYQALIRPRESAADVDLVV